MAMQIGCMRGMPAISFDCVYRMKKHGNDIDLIDGKSWRETYRDVMSVQALKHCALMMGYTVHALQIMHVAS